ncbi:hypothetical protein COO60DRAFT_1547550 [Scenedesmus sp. NREL 46B-D3]|nr:hypothetical protein COO60DRAFT_1547550 [Scenedesmus sp. NREL 46B-D3]
MSHALLLGVLLALCSYSSDASSGSTIQSMTKPLKGRSLLEPGSSSSSSSLQDDVSSISSIHKGATCRSGAKAISGCAGTPPARSTCEGVQCLPGLTCAMYTCEGRCVPLCSSPGDAGTCPAGVPVAQCGDYDPCAATLCLVGTFCVPRRCGRCTAECRPLPPSPSPSPDPAAGSICLGDTEVKCLVDPCQLKNCTADRVCASEYCKGCNAACLLRARCPSGKERRPCLGTANRCIAVKLGGGVTCVPDQCNDCAAVGVGPCRPGRYVNSELMACRLCPRGYACAGGSSTSVTARPKPCNGGKYANMPGLARCKQCPPGTTTPALPANKGYTKCS